MQLIRAFSDSEGRAAIFPVSHINAVSFGIYAASIICAGRSRHIQGPTRSAEEAKVLRQQIEEALTACYAPTQLLTIKGWLIVLPTVAEVFIGSGHSPHVCFANGEPMPLYTSGLEESAQVFDALQQALKRA